MRGLTAEDAVLRGATPYTKQGVDLYGKRSNKKWLHAYAHAELQGWLAGFYVNTKKF